MRDESETTALMWAVQRGHEGLIKLLLEKGAELAEKVYTAVTGLRVVLL